MLQNPRPSTRLARNGFIHAVPTGRRQPLLRAISTGRSYVVLCRSKGRVHNSIKASDHYPVSFESACSLSTFHAACGSFFHPKQQPAAALQSLRILLVLNPGKHPPPFYPVPTVHSCRTFVTLPKMRRDSGG